MLSHYCPPTVVFSCPACLELALGNHPLCMGRRWFRIGFICDEDKGGRVGQALQYVISDESWFPLFLAVQLSNRGFCAQNFFDCPHYTIVCCDLPGASKSLSN
jgi:hypothetical protein